MFSQYSATPFTVEQVEVQSVDGSVTTYPTLASRDEVVNVADVNARIGIDIPAKEMAALLTRMCLSATVVDGGKKFVDIFAILKILSAV